MPTRRPQLAAGVLLAALVSFTACGSDGSNVDLSPEAAEGRRIAASSGCAACHGSNGQGGIGPAFVGLFGSEVELEDGSTVVADEAYVIESVTDPGAKRVAGYSQRMPENDLDDDEVTAIVQYVVELAEPAATTAP